MKITKERYDQLKVILKPEELKQFSSSEPVSVTLDLTDKSSIGTTDCFELEDLEIDSDCYCFQGRYSTYVIPIEVSNLEDAHEIFKMIRKIKKETNGKLHKAPTEQSC